MTDPDEKRRETRLPLDVEIEIRTPDHTVRAMAGDVSMSGLFVQSEEFFPIGTICEVKVVVSSGEQQLSMEGQAQVVRQVENPETGTRGMGFKFLGLSV